MKQFDQERVERAVRELLTGIGEDPDSDDLCETPSRVARAWREMVAGREQDAKAILGKTFGAARYDEVVLLRGVSFYSTCEHHLLPFSGIAHVAYVPGGSNGGGATRVVGLSKLARLVEMHARRLQLQERMTSSIADDLEKVLKPTGVAVVVSAQHLCMCARGVGKPGAEMRTSVMRGCFRDKPEARAELMSLIDGR